MKNKQIKQSKWSSVTIEQLDKHRKNPEFGVETKDLLSEAAGEMIQWLSENGLTQQGDTIYFDEEQLDDIGEGAELIVSEDWQFIKSIWGEDGFFDGGDDFDYNGTWIVELVDSIENYIHWLVENEKKG